MSIEFEGFQDKKSLHQQMAFVEHPSIKFLWRRLALALFSALMLVLVVRGLDQAKQDTGQVPVRLALWVPILLLAIYYLTIHPYIASYLAAFQASTQPQKESFRKGEISSEGIQHSSPDQLELIPWSKIYRAKQTDDLVVLFAEYVPSMAFPRHFFKTEFDWQQFNRWVEYYVKDRS